MCNHGDHSRHGILAVLMVLLLCLPKSNTVGVDSFPTWDRAHPDAPVPARDNALLAQNHPQPSTHPRAVSPSGNLQSGRVAAKPSLRSDEVCFHSESTTGTTNVCTSSDIGDGTWEPSGGLGYRWRPAACKLRYATQAELRCILAGKRVAMVGDSLIRNLFDGLAHHAKLSVVAGTGYGPKTKQHDAYAMDAADDILVQLHWAPCAVPANSPQPPGLSHFGRVQWADCQAAATIGRESESSKGSKSQPGRPRDLGDLLRGFGVRRDRSRFESRLHTDTALRCPASQSLCVHEQTSHIGTGGSVSDSTETRVPTEGTRNPTADGRICAEKLQPLPSLLALASAAQGVTNNISCVVGYAAEVGTNYPRYEIIATAGQQLPDPPAPLSPSCWRQFCEPPQIIVLNLGLWQTEFFSTAALAAFERSVREHLMHLDGIETVVFLLPWRVRDKTVTYDGVRPSAATGRRLDERAEPDLEWMGNPAAALGKVPRDSSTVGLYSDVQLKAVGKGLRTLCNKFNAERVDKLAAASRGERDSGRPPWRCAVVDPWEASYSKHPFQRERRKEEGGSVGNSEAKSSEAGGWWTDGRHLHPAGDLMKAIIQLLATAILEGGV